MKQNIFKKICKFAAVFMTILAMPLLANAAGPISLSGYSRCGGTDQVSTHLGQFGDLFPTSRIGTSCDAGGFIYEIILLMLTIAAGLAVLFLIIGGYWYITSAGNEEQAEKGQKTVVNAIIGIIVIVLSYVIINVVVRFVSR